MREEHHASALPWTLSAVPTCLPLPLAGPNGSTGVNKDKFELKWMRKENEEKEKTVK